MKENKEVTFVLNKLPKTTMVVNVKLTRLFRFRLWLAKQAIIFACWMLNSDLEYNKVENHNG